MSDKERIERLEKVLLSALLILKSFPQCSNFSDVSSYVHPSFRDAIRDCTRELSDLGNHNDPTTTPTPAPTADPRRKEKCEKCGEEKCPNPDGVVPGCRNRCHGNCAPASTADPKWDEASLLFHQVRHLPSGDGIRLIVEALEDAREECENCLHADALL